MDKRKILVVDDELYVRLMLKGALNKDYLVLEARDGEEAIDKIAVGNFDVVITDIRMPKVNGIEVLKFTKKNKPKTKVIVMSIFVSQKVINKIIELGADKYIEKYLFLKDIISILDKIN